MSIDIQKRKAIQAQAELDSQNIKSQADAFKEKYNAADESGKDALLKDFFKKSYVKQDVLAEAEQDIKDGVDESRIMKKIFNKSLPVFFIDQRNEAVVPDGLHKLDDIIPFETVTNGAVRMDYQDFSGVDSLEPYGGSGTQADGTWVEKFTMFGADDFAMENWETLHTMHKGITEFVPLFTNAHKDELLFVLQLNDRIKRVGQAIDNFMLGVKGKYLWMAEDVDLDDSNGKFVINPTAAPAPDRTITAATFKDGIAKLNTYLMTLTSAVRNHFVKGSAAEALFQVKGLKQQLQRSVSLDDITMITSNDFKNKYDMFVQAGAFNMSKASILAKVAGAMKSFSYENDFGAQFANITGLNEYLEGDSADNITGSVDLIFIVPGTISVINQFNEVNEFKVPNETIALNTWMDFGIKINKKENNFYERVRLTIGTPKDNK